MIFDYHQSADWVNPLSYIEHLLLLNEEYNTKPKHSFTVSKMAQGKMKNKVKLPSNIKTKSIHRVDMSRKKQPNRPKKSKKKNLLQKEVEKEIRKGIEADARAKAAS